MAKMEIKMISSGRKRAMPCSVLPDKRIQETTIIHKPALIPLASGATTANLVVEKASKTIRIGSGGIGASFSSAQVMAILPPPKRQNKAEARSQRLITVPKVPSSPRKPSIASLDDTSPILRLRSTFGSTTNHH